MRNTSCSAQTWRLPLTRLPLRSGHSSGPRLARWKKHSVHIRWGPPPCRTNAIPSGLTNSSCERVLFPEASILTDHCIRLMTTVVEGLVINRAAIRRNLAFLHGINMAESVMIELTKRGMNRQDAHERVRMASMQALVEEQPLADILVRD